LFCLNLVLKSQAHTKSDFKWGNTSYFNINVGESVVFQDTEIKLLQIKNHYNQLLVGEDTIWLKISRRTLPTVVSGVRIFIADNRNVKALDLDSGIHSLLSKDVLVALSSFKEPMLDSKKFIFPISFNDGFLWSVEEDSHMFSYVYEGGRYNSHGGIDIDLHDARGLEKHWIIALENSRVVWVKVNENKKESCILLESESQAGIYYVYKHLNQRKVEVKEGDRLLRGEAIGTIWGDEIWGHLHLSVIKSDTVPDIKSKYSNAVNFFPQLYELYFKQIYSFYRSYSKGIIHFGQRRNLRGNQKNISAFEPYSGKGWVFGKWNTTDRVEYSIKGETANARVRKILFSQKKASCKNPNNWYDYEISVHNGVYRIRAKVGDISHSSWQKIQFENVLASTYSLEAGEQKWTPEKVVKVNDGKLTVRIFVKENNIKPAGISQIVFQKAY
jgi:hypothetical protein